MIISDCSDWKMRIPIQKDVIKVPIIIVHIDKSISQTGGLSTKKGEICL
jgi:hypothetical protein